MVARKLYHQHWRAYFDWITRNVAALAVQVDLAGSDGDPQARGERLLGVSYDPETELVTIRTAEHDHHLPKPQMIYVFESSDSLVRMELLLADGSRHHLELNRPLAMPPLL